jgi:hypothetical protein
MAVKRWNGTAWVIQSGNANAIKYQATAPADPVTGDVWVKSDVDVSSFDSSQFLRWRETAVGGETSLSGNDDNGLPLRYTPGYEQVYINGVLQVRNQDYTATTGTTVTGLIALVANDVVEVFSVVARSAADVYTQTQSDARFASQTNFPAGVWTSYTPIVSGTGWSIGNGSRTGKYVQFGKTVHFTANIAFGSTSTYGGGVLFISVPVSGNGGTDNMRWVSYDISTTTQYFNQARFETGSTCTAVLLNTNGSVSGYFTNTSPFTWASGDSIIVTGTYEAV